VKTVQPYGYGIYRCRFNVASGALESEGWGIWQWQNTGNAPDGKFNEIDAIEIYGDGFAGGLPAGGSTGSAYRNNLWIQCPMVSNPPASCVRGADLFPQTPINDAQWHELEYRIEQSYYELKIDGRSLRTITDTNIPRPPMALYAGLNVHSQTHPLELDIDECSFSVVPPDLDAEFVAQGSDAAADPEGKAYYRVCAGKDFHFWFEVRNTGLASWVDWNQSGVGQSVRLGVPSGQPDVFTSRTRISLTENLNTDVHPASFDPAGVDCSDQAYCTRTRFSKGAGIKATAPSSPGVYTTTWQLVDESHGWFGPHMWLSFNVVACP